ncbi:MarR family transcriptional regulator [Marinicauda algicola]|uniref:MarR family transcriptional regulator n=1 Tax=Marinicauda algicola TaxID=2029849 RepID=A0A4S2H0S9_9PROT|nr:MarR family transcriptional regulator [Marinicauda algicola]TGY89115.1 MarR family transcriptional regulator [Marinicauda algicola]
MSDVIDRLIAEWDEEAPELDTSGMAIAGRLIALGDRLRERATRVLGQFALSYREFDVLATLRRGGPPYARPAGELARAVVLSSGAMTACLDRMERRGLISRERSDQDRRTVIVRLTAEGRALALKAARAWFRSVNALFAEAEADGLGEPLRCLLAGVETDAARTGRPSTGEAGPARAPHRA